MTSDFSVRRRRRCLPALLLAPLSVGLIGAGAVDVSAQGGHRVTVGGAPTAGTTTVTPRSAAPGETVWIRVAYLPPATPVQFMVGALRDGFEIVSTNVTDAGGRINGADSLQMEVPEWVTWDRPYLMIVTDAEYGPLGSADMFHPTDDSGRLKRAGKIDNQGTGCPSLTGAADEIYFLLGDTSALRTGDKVTIVGRALETSVCGTGTAIEIHQVERIPND
jgi:hypothetical protein